MVVLLHQRHEVEPTRAAPPDSLAARTYQPLLRPGLHKLIGFASRMQGLMVRRGNPRGIAGVSDVARPGLRFVNRPRGSGTRVLLDELLAQAGIAPAELPGYDDTEPSHAAVAQPASRAAPRAGHESRP